MAGPRALRIGFVLIYALATLITISIGRSETLAPFGDHAANREDLPDGGIQYFVNTTSDTVVIGACENGDPGCSLRGAIQTANAHPGADGIDINLPPGSIINLTGALPDITESVSISGDGADKLTVRRDTGGDYRIFTVDAAGPVIFSGMTISNGNTGGIAINHGTVNLLNMTITGNSAGNFGGGIVNVGTLTVTNSLIVGNTAALGGGIYNDGNFTLTNSTVTGNMAQVGGGIYFGDGTVVLSNSTICRNDAEGFAGGIATADTHPVTKNTIIALNTSDMNPDVFGDFTSQGFNLIGIGGAASGFTQPTDQTGTVAQPLDPKLAGLQNNGGPTQTVALLIGSPAIDKGTSNSVNGNLTTDQRGNGFPRRLDYSSVANAVGGDGTDIGALEFGGSLVPLSVSRKTHGAAGTFDVDLPLTGNAGIECRSGGATGDHQLVLTFPNAVTVNGNPQAQVTSGAGQIGTGGTFNGGVVTVSGSTVTVSLTNVANAQMIIVTLFGVSDGANTNNVSIPMRMLLGDATVNATVNASDISQTKARLGQAITNANFRSDINRNGAINASDVSLIKSQGGTSIP